MKLTYRDKVLLISVLVILVWVAGVMLFIKPAFDDLSAANKTYDSKVIDLNAKKDKIDKDKNLPQRVTDAFDEVSKLASNFYGKLSTDDVSEIIDKLLDADKITNDSLAISSYSSVVLDVVSNDKNVIETDIDKIVNGEAVDETTQKKNAAAANAQAESTAVTVPCYTVSFGYTCEFKNLKSFLDKLTTNNEKSLVVTSCTITDVNAKEIEGQMTLVMMMMPQIENPIEADKADKANQAE